MNTDKIVFEDVLREGYASQEVVLSTSEETLHVNLLIEGRISEWITIMTDDEVLVNKTLILSRNAPARITVIAEPPFDAVTTKYNSSIYFLVQEDVSIENPFNTRMIFAMHLPISLHLTDERKDSCVLGGLRITPIESGAHPVLEYSFRNTGNARIQPEIFVELYNKERTNIQATQTIIPHTEIFPTISARFSQELFSERVFVSEKYWVDIHSSCGESTSITFDVLEQGAIADRGELITLNTPLFAQAGDILPVQAQFRNRGLEAVTAYVELTLQDTTRPQRTTRFTSEPVTVLAGASQSIETFIIPKQEGTYTITGKVHYNNKVTFDEQKILTITKKDSALHALFSKLRLPNISFSNISFGFIFLITIIFLLLLIIKKKKQIIQQKTQQKQRTPVQKTKNKILTKQQRVRK